MSSLQWGVKTSCCISNVMNAATIIVNRFALLVPKNFMG